jgi:hypothetical protein
MTSTDEFIGEFYFYQCESLTSVTFDPGSQFAQAAFSWLELACIPKTAIAIT